MTFWLHFKPWLFSCLKIAHGCCWAAINIFVASHDPLRSFSTSWPTDDNIHMTLRLLLANRISNNSNKYIKSKAHYWSYIHEYFPQLHISQPPILLQINHHQDELNKYGNLMFGLHKMYILTNCYHRRSYLMKFYLDPIRQSRLQQYWNSRLQLPEVTNKRNTENST